MTNYLTMTLKELNINTVMGKVIKHKLDIKEASDLIGKSERQTKRIKKRYIEEWPEWLIHKARWRPSNHKIDENKYQKAIQIIKDKYYDYWPTLSAEKLSEKHNIVVNISSLRKQMIKAGIWKNKKRKKDDKQFTARARKETYGEMLQYDWSYHKWFEERNGTEYQCLLVSVDDSTWEMDAKFAKNEGLVETFKFWKEYILSKWKPKSIYLDKYATYKVNYPDATDDRELPTQFGRACKFLWIKLIFANTPQAKWRVERMNWTLQDRLVKALREEKISNMETANKFLKEKFLPDFNKKFMKEARSSNNMHIDLREDEKDKLDQIFSEHKQRKVANDFTIRFENKYYQLYRRKTWWYTLRTWEKVTIEKHLNGDIMISKNLVYITSKTSFERPERQFKLLTAPISESSLILIKGEIVERERLEQIEKQRIEEDNKTDTYYQTHWKAHPFIANCFS